MKVLTLQAAMGSGVILIPIFLFLLVFYFVVTFLTFKYMEKFYLNLKRKESISLGEYLVVGLSSAVIGLVITVGIGYLCITLLDLMIGESFE